MSTQNHDQNAYQVSQLAEHMRRFSEATAAAYHNLDVDTSSFHFPSSASLNASSSSSSNSKGGISPMSNYSDRSENSLRTPSLPTFAPVPPYNANTATMSNVHDQTYPVSSTHRPASDPLYANPTLYSAAPPKAHFYPYGSAHPPTATSYLDPGFFMPAFGICQPSQGSSTVQLPQHTYTDMDPAPASGPFYTGMVMKSASTSVASIPSYSFDPSYSSEPYPAYAPAIGHQTHGINPQILSLDMFQMPAESQPPPTSVTVFDEPLVFSPTPEWSPSFDSTQPRIPRASSVSPLPRITKPQRPTLRRHSDSYTSDHVPLSNPVGPAKKGRKRKSGWSVDANIEWEGMMDKKERRKMQNRMAQRAFRARMKAHKE